MGELLCPLPGAGLSAVSLPREAPGGTTPVAAVSSGNLYSAPAKLGSSLSAGPGGSWAGPLICSALSRSVLAILGPPCLRLSQQRPNPGLCPGALCSRACAVGFSLLAIQLPHCRATARAPPSSSWSCAAPSTRRLFLCRRRHRQGAPGAAQISTHRATAGASQCYSLVNACALQPLGSSVHSPGSAGLC